MDEVKRTINLMSLQRYYHFFNWRLSIGRQFIARNPLFQGSFAMRFKILFPVFFIFFNFVAMDGFGQLGITYDLKKPEKYENRKLGYEKTEETKFKLPRHFIQNTITHYNYYFNANNKLNEILARAKAQNRDDYTKLLPFYNYSLDVTLRDKRNLDSLIDKVNTAILVHDLRNDWVDNLYMLMGKAYYYRKELDSAYITFQFINYAFGPKEKEGYLKPIGSNANADEGGSAISVSTNEKRNIVKKTFSLPPSRNESLIWQIRTFITKDELGQAAAMIQTLKLDPLFPARLHPDLQEMQALWFYKKNMYDSAAIHLEKALGNASSRLELARWEYLIAQLYERSDKHELAKTFYERVTQHTYDPVMDVYARLNAIRQNKGNDAGDDYIQKSIDALQKMARKETYESYRDIIYYAAAEMELEKNNKPGAISFLLKATRSALPGSAYRDKAFLLLGDLEAEQKRYKEAKNYYDSVNMTNPAIAENLQAFQEQKNALTKIVEAQRIIDRQDSLQKIAMMPENERNAYIKKMVKLIRKQQGLAEEEQPGGQNFSFNSNNGPTDLFGSSPNGDWYFYNSSLKSKGYSDFKAKWGNRPNVDNWNVSALMARQKASIGNGQPLEANGAENNTAQSLAVVTSATLLANVPLTPEKMKKSMDSTENALFTLGKAYQDLLPDYLAAITAYNNLLAKFPDTRFYEETLYHLYYCYKKINDETNAATILQVLQQKYPSGKYTFMIKNPEAADPEKTNKSNATKQYEKIYGEFIEGNFDHAIASKKEADSLYGDKYWTPQLLYIESVYFIHERQDSSAKIELSNIIKKYSGTPMAIKAKTMLDVLNRRKQIEDYLTNLNIQRATDDSVTTDSTTKAPLNNLPQQAKVAEIKSKPITDSAALAKAKIKTDSAQAVKKVPAFASAFTYAPDKTHGVAILMNKVDPVYVTETRNAFNRYNRESYYNKTFEINNIALDDTTKLVVINGFENAQAALDYMQKAQKLAPREIIPWLPGAKYSFLIISGDNLEVLKNNKDMANYKKFLNAYFPGKF
jgi:tetratricopeptide (TPR) repeat protein